MHSHAIQALQQPIERRHSSAAVIFRMMKTPMKRNLFILTLGAAIMLGACSTVGSLNPLKAKPQLDNVVAAQASAGPLELSEGRAFLDNDAAFAAKLRLIESARESLDLAYYIFADDYSSSILTQALIDAAQRGVRVRLLVDYFSAYKDLDRYTWLEQQGAGRIEVRFYNRPTLDIIKDAAYLTLSCADVGASGSACDDAKFAAVERHFATEAISGQTVTNRSYAGSSLFLSGLYGKNTSFLAYAITRGQAIDADALGSSAQDATSTQADQLKRLGKLYFQARYRGGVEGLSARLKLGYVRFAYGEQVNPVFDTVNALLPLNRRDSAQARQDWDYLTEFLHHKFLLADEGALILGGRNVEDAYHMQPNPLSSKYIFMDTDVGLQLARTDPALATSFDRLWQLRSMVATLDDVRQHAPNDLLVNFDAVQAAQSTCQTSTDARCFDREFDRRARTLAQRMQAEGERHRAHLTRYQQAYRAARTHAPLRIDAEARIHYFENLPTRNGQRGYGVDHGGEAANKHIHALWRAALHDICLADASSSREVVFHNAYLFLPANLLQDIGAMLDGSRNCSGLTLTLLTNSLETTDLNVVNLLAVWQLKALADHLRERKPGADAATLRYLEYQPGNDSRLSLHSKVMLFGDDIFIGSANADVRSLMMDSNNGVFIRNAPAFVREYRDTLNTLIATPGRIADHTATLGRDSAELQMQTNQMVELLLARYAGDDRLSDVQRRELKQDVATTTQRVYTLSREILRGSRKAADEFNALFKAI